MRLKFLGAAHMVTGSCYLLETQGKKILIDCGMFQGTKRIREMNREDFSFVPAELDAVLLTHAHVDHCGLIPKLCHDGFTPRKRRAIWHRLCCRIRPTFKSPMQKCAIAKVAGAVRSRLIRYIR